MNGVFIVQFCVLFCPFGFYVLPYVLLRVFVCFVVCLAAFWRNKPCMYVCIILSKATASVAFGPLIDFDHKVKAIKFINSLYHF